MGTFYSQYPASSGGSANASVGTNGSTAPTSSTEVAGVNPSGNQQPLQTDASGNLKVDIAASNVTLNENVSQFGGSAVVTGTGISGAGIPRVTVSSDSTVGVSSLPSLPAGSNAIGSVSVSNFPATQPVSGTLTVVQPTAANLNATVTGSVSVSNFPGTQPVSGTVAVSSLPSLAAGSNAIGSITNTSFAATQATASALNATVTGSGTAGTPAAGVVSVQGVSGGTTIPVTASIASAQTLANVTTLGTITNALPTGTNNIGSITNITGTVSLPTGAATSALQTTAITSLSTVATNTTRQTTFTDRSGTTSATINTSTQVAASNTSRKYFIIQNLSSTASIFINFTTAASTTSGSLYLAPYGSFVMESGALTTEAINVVSATASVPFAAKEG